MLVVVLVVVVVVLVVVVLVVLVVGATVVVEVSLVRGAPIDTVATSAVGESDPHAAAIRIKATASSLVRSTETTVVDRRGATLAP